jgi:hypothetical protein
MSYSVILDRNFGEQDVLSDSPFSECWKNFQHPSYLNKNQCQYCGSSVRKEIREESKTCHGCGAPIRY